MSNKKVDEGVKASNSAEGTFGGYNYSKKDYNLGISDDVEQITTESHAAELAKVLRESVKTTSENHRVGVILNQAQNKKWFDFFRRNSDYGIKVVATNRADSKKLEPGLPTPRTLGK